MNNDTLKCLFCGGDLIWDGDANLEDVYDEAQDDDGGVINC